MILFKNSEIQNMDLFLLILSFVVMIIGIIGSIIPVLPGPLSSWVGLFIFSNISNVEVSALMICICTKTSATHAYPRVANAP